MGDGAVAPVSLAVVTTVAILGGGQLGLMLGEAAAELDVTCRFLDPSPDACAARVGELVVGALDDADALARVADGADVVTYEWEGVPASSLALLADRGCTVLPPEPPLAISQDRLDEKSTCRRLGIGTPDFVPVAEGAALAIAARAVGFPFVLKTRRGGYDGKGQVVVRSPDDLDGAWDQLGGVPLILEARVGFDRELSILAARDAKGMVVTWPVVENVHRDGILRTSMATHADSHLQARAEQVARKLLEHFDYVGVLAVELFQVGDELLVNELAPRVHNSGHWTIEGAATSQFENHLRAVLGLPLGGTESIGFSAMVNCVGVLPDPAAIAGVPGARLHDYGKAARHRRKVGHVTVVADTIDARDARARDLLALIPSDG